MISPEVTAKIRVLNFFNDFRLENVPELKLEALYIVWFSQNQKNWKAVVKTYLPDDIYYEVTYNSESEETYLDVYTKMYNFVISDQEKEDPNQLKLDVFTDNTNVDL